MTNVEILMEKPDSMKKWSEKSANVTNAWGGRSGGGGGWVDGQP